MLELLHPVAFLYLSLSCFSALLCCLPGTEPFQAFAFTLTSGDRPGRPVRSPPLCPTLPQLHTSLTAEPAFLVESAASLGPRETEGAIPLGLLDL